MKIYLTSDNSGGWSLESFTMTGTGRHLCAMPALLAKWTGRVQLTYFYDILGKGLDKDIKHSLLKKGELK